MPVTSARNSEHLRDELPGIGDPIVTNAPGGVPRSIEERYGLARKLERARIDVVHGTKHILPRRAPCPTVLTVYDLFAFTRKNDYRWSKRILLPAVYRQSLAQADRIVTMTHSVRDEVLARGLARAEKVAVVPAAPSTALTGARLRQRPRSPTVVSHSVSAIDPRVRTWSYSCASGRASIRRRGLVLALIGPDRSRSEATRARVAALEVSGAVMTVDEVSDGGLRWCYEHADGRAHPIARGGLRPARDRSRVLRRSARDEL